MRVTVTLAQPHGLGDMLLEATDVGLSVSTTAPRLGVTRCVPSIEYSGEPLDSTEGDAESDAPRVMTVCDGETVKDAQPEGVGDDTSDAEVEAETHQETVGDGYTVDDQLPVYDARNVMTCKTERG